jgi:D-alanine-D-alanine ligase-like ATP-grasp enzyme
MSPEKQGVEVQEHYPYVTRSLLRLYGQGVLTHVVDIDVEPKYGYATRLTYTDGNHRITYGSDLGLNSGAACDLAKDKGHSKFMLRTIGVNCPDGEEFLLPWWAERLKSSPRQSTNEDIRTIDQAPSYIEENLGYPVYIKPVDGSQGKNIYKLHAVEQLQEAVNKYGEKQVRVAVVEESVDMPDYRVVCLDGELISAYQRTPLTVTGDGVSTIRDLITAKQEIYDIERDTKLDPDSPDIEQNLLSYGLSIDSIPSTDEVLPLVPTSNLSAGGTSDDVTETIHPTWTELSIYIAKNFNLRLCGVDLACEDITDPDAGYSVIEVNAAPGLDHYAMSGEAQKKIVDQLYTKVFNAMPN